MKNIIGAFVFQLYLNNTQKRLTSEHKTLVLDRLHILRCQKSKRKRTRVIASLSQVDHLSLFLLRGLTLGRQMQPPVSCSYHHLCSSNETIIDEAIHLGSTPVPSIGILDPILAISES